MDKKAYVNSNLYYVYNNLFRVVGRCVLCGKSFKASKELSEHVKLHHPEDLRGCLIKYYAFYVKARYNASNSETKRLRQCLSDLEVKIKSKAGISIFEISDANNQEAWSKVVELLPEVYYQSKPQLEGALKTLADYLYMLKNISLDMPLYSNLTISDSSVDYSEVFASYESFLKTIKLIG